MGTAQRAVWIAVAVWVLAIVPAWAQTPTPGGSTYVTGQCGSVTLDSNTWIQVSNVTPTSCGVPSGATSIQFHFRVDSYTGSPTMKSYRTVYEDDTCTLPVSGQPLAGAECVIDAGGVSDDFYAKLTSEFGAINGTIWFTAYGGYGGGGGTPTPTPPDFTDPIHIEPPTRIPDISLPSIARLPAPPPTPNHTPYPLSTPSLPGLSLPETPIATMQPIYTDLALAVSTPVPLSYTLNSSASNAISGTAGLLLGTRGILSGVISQTNALSTTIYSATFAVDVLNTDHAPAWYAPALPRPIADVGWRFEQMGQDTRKRYSIAAWGVWVAEIVALPIQFVKGLAPLAQLLGPFGLFIAWLLIMLPVVLGFRILHFLKNLLIQIFNFIWTIIRVIGDIWDMLPFA